MNRDTYCKDRNGEPLFEGDIVGVYISAADNIPDEILRKKAAGKYRIVFKYNNFRLETIEANWFYDPTYFNVSDFNILEKIT
ncbi:MAG TPA: hypothetical protein PKX31_00145 [Chitinophagaceae bacterium]|nr:hypothetical protein [Chitinophagaceae bacterium]